MIKNKHALTQLPLGEKRGWSRLKWKFKGTEKSELIKYPDRYMAILWENGVEKVTEEKVWTNPDV